MCKCIYNFYVDVSGYDGPTTWNHTAQFKKNHGARAEKWNLNHKQHMGVCVLCVSIPVSKETALYKLLFRRGDGEDM